MRFIAFFTLALPLWAPLATAADAARDETRDALLREQQELNERAEALADQQATTQRLLEQQQAYLDALEKEIQSLKAAPESDQKN
ncbi:hypothetical protein B5T_03313 [Alloalcanivorax dieselolei B5]|uniref:Tol-pal system protein YbgF n=1 Tax=Alcanivorax dieselolei (strain DSM 16502 / CGMCC 1.3690 / MCCC 1A00001 / B-5) TaxID=930169 RepID=K0CGQ3_ALCDB|nr:hypothetical protein [Alloalcanivorax dieselolei]AFT71580.1 hypothetical protein B5T_03313 [Alloalcanivorax dieselolei B5]GGJ89783.1 hypothetical protein GCM10007426_18690 [Alloalcanivorax dieselolei]